MKCSIGYFAYDDELWHKPIHASTVHAVSMFHKEIFEAKTKQKKTINKMNVACGSRISFVFDKLILWQSLRAPLDS